MKIRGVITAAGLSIAVAAGVTAVAQAGVGAKHFGARAKVASSLELAYVGAVNRSQVWAIHNGGAARKLAAGSRPIVSPNGDYIATSSSNTAGYLTTRIYSRSGVLLKSYLPLHSGYTAPLAWSRDSRYLAVSVSMDRGPSVYELAVIDTRRMTAKTILDVNVATVSFAPAGVGEPADEMVFDEYSTTSDTAGENLYETKATGGSVKQLTADGVSVHPVWGRRGIFFDRESMRSVYEEPAFQIWLLSGGKARQVTHLKFGADEGGLEPVAVSANGNRLIAKHYGAGLAACTWEIQLSPFVSKAVTTSRNGGCLQAEGISSDGKKLLVVGESPKTRNSVVEWLPFGGGKARVLANGIEASWNW